MTTIYTNQEKYSGQTPISYGESGITYGELGYMYMGKITTVFNEQTKNDATYTNKTKSATTYTNEIKN